MRSRCEEEWPAYVSRGGSDLPRPILFFVAAKKNGFACYGRGGNDLPRPIQIFVAAEKNGPPAERHYHSAASILDFGPRLVNHCLPLHIRNVSKPHL